MYSEFFGLKLTPFNNTPDPRFFYNTPEHEEAVASLIYAAQERKGFSLLTGEVGSGKTLISRLILSRLERSAKFAVIHNTRVGPRELLFSICREFDVRVAPDAAAPEMSRALEEFLLDQYARDRLAVVIVDEAQHLTSESFEELRLLGNLEADDAKLMSVLILGQPELQQTFRLPEMRQLQQRLFRSIHLKGLTRELTDGYIAHRLRVAGLLKGPNVFDRSALDAIYDQSGGVPRLINQICDGAMLAAYTRSTKKITAEIVAEVMEQSRATAVPSRLPVSTLVPAAGRESSRRYVVETHHAEESIRQLEDRVREATASSEQARKMIDASIADAKRTSVGESVAEIQAAQRGLDELIKEQRRQLSMLRADADATTHRARSETAALKSDLDKFRCTVVENLHHERKALEVRIAESSRASAELESRTQHLTAGMTAAWREFQKTYQESMGGAREAVVMIREQSGASLGQLRDALAQINERSTAIRVDLIDFGEQLKSGSAKDVEWIKQTVGEQLERIRETSDSARRELAELGDQVKVGSAKSVEGLKLIVARLLQQIEDRRTHFRKDVEQSLESMGSTGKQLAADLSDAKETLRQIIEDAKARFDAGSSQTRDILAQAQTSAITTQNQAVQLLAESRGFSERLREQVEASVRRADETAAATGRELQELRSDLRKDREQVRDQIIESKMIVQGARQEAAKTIEQARAEATRLIETANTTTSRLFEEAGRFERESQSRAERIIQHARETEGRVDALLRLPKEIIDEANARTASLADLSKSLSSVISQLGAAGETARTQKQEILEASALAEERLEGLRSHTTRVGQLVGIIRQLYGVLDARIEGLRERLDQADDLCRTVPREIDGLRSALNSGRHGNRGPESSRPKTSSGKAAPTSPRGRSAVLKAAGGSTGAPPAPGMLGDIVSRNRKLHEWLRQTLREAESHDAKVEPDDHKPPRTATTPARESEAVSA